MNDEYERLQKAGYWLGATQAYKDRCTCPHPTARDAYGDKHQTTCPRWVSEWVRRNSAKDLTRG